MCQKLLPTSFIRPHNHQDELSTPWATLLKTFAGYTWMEKELQAMPAAQPGSLQSRGCPGSAFQAEPPGRAGGCSAPAPHQAVPEAGTCLSSSSALACTDTTKSLLSTRPCTGSTWDRESVHRRVFFGPTFLACVTARSHAHFSAFLSSISTWSLENSFIRSCTFCPSTSSVTFLSCLNVVRKI